MRFYLNICVRGLVTVFPSRAERPDKLRQLSEQVLAYNQASLSRLPVGKIDTVLAVYQ
jgi:hypothetical protein